MELDLEDRLRSHVEALAGGSRNRARAGSLERARGYCRQHLEEHGWSVEERSVRALRLLPVDRNDGSLRSVFWPPQIAGVVEGRNLVASPEVMSEGDLLIVAHVDTVVDSPGADDNASGVAVSLELARLLDAQARIGVAIALVDLEEMEKIGSTQLARTLPRPGGVICLESIGYFSDEDGSQSIPGPLARNYPQMAEAVAARASRGDFLLSVHQDRSADLHEQLQRALSDNGVPVIGLRDRRWQGWGPRGVGNGLVRPFSPTAMHLDRSDHAPFWRRGVAAVMLTGTATLRNKHYHQPGDTPERLDYARLARVCTGVLAVASASNAQILGSGPTRR